MTYLTEEQAQQIEEVLSGMLHGTDWNNGTHAKIYRPKFPEALATIRAARAQEPITTPDVCGEVCARAKLCYGCNKDLEKANAKYVEQAEQEPVAWAISHSLGLEFGSKYPMQETKEAAEQMARQHMGAVVVTPLYAAPVRAKDLTDIEDLQDAVTKALKKAFQLGQTYWQQADSESYAANKRADVTQELYWKLEDDTRAAIAADRELNRA